MEKKNGDIDVKAVKRLLKRAQRARRSQGKPATYPAVIKEIDSPHVQWHTMADLHRKGGAKIAKHNAGAIVTWSLDVLGEWA